VKLKKDTTFSRSLLTTLNEKHQVYSIEKVCQYTEGTILDNIYLLHVPMASDILSIVEEYVSCPGVVYAEPNSIGYPLGIPNDADFSVQWYLHNTGQVFYNDSYYHLFGTPDADIDAPEAWDIETGSPDVVIAIIDSGIDYTHPDLAANIWNNTDEIPGNGIDDDHNHYIDDIRGWYFFANNSNVTDGHGHGTMCSGLAGAITNNGIGIAGVGCNCKIMPVRIADRYWSTTLVMASMGIRYAADNGADICSMSFGFPFNNLMKDMIDYAYGKGVFLCAAAGNSNTSTKFYPAAYDNVTAVAMTNQNDSRCSPEDWNQSGWGSNYGEWVDIAAPGNAIYSTMPTYHVIWNDNGFTQNYAWCTGGTSFSSPMVAGVAALLLSKDPSLTPDQVKALLCGNVDPYNSTEYIGTGRLNAQKALTALHSSVDVKIKGGLGVKMVIANNGLSNVTDVTWQIHVEGGILGMINKTKNGTIDISAGESITVSTGMLLGLGGISICARVSGIEKMGNGTQMFIFSIVK
jgi:subtilisin family serine protease